MMYGLFSSVAAAAWCTLLILAAAPARGDAIFCRCNTWDCEEQNLALCATDFQCYVQVTASDNPAEPSDVLYGCLAQTSILCQNPRPQHFQGSWPIVQCCSTDLCNRDMLPTEPPEWKRGRRPSTVDPLNEPTPSTPQQQHHQPNITVHPNRHSAPSTSSFAVNPLYIAVPIAGAVILVVLVIFAVYLLRRQPRNASDYKYHTAPQLVDSTKKPAAQDDVNNYSKSLHHNGQVGISSKNKGHNGLVVATAVPTPARNAHNGLVSSPRNSNGLFGLPSSTEKAGGALPAMAVVEPFNSSRPPIQAQSNMNSSSGNSYPAAGQGFPNGGPVPCREFPSSHNSDRPDPDGERSSSGSESKLLLRV